MSALPWLDEPLQRALREQRSHALLVHGPSGVGQFEFALALAQGWLCEVESGDQSSPHAAVDAAQAGARRPCGHCASCRLVAARSHPDLLVLLPEALRTELGWEIEGGDESGAADKSSKAKPSKEIKVEAVRAAVAFAQTTSARGRGKAVVLHPAERMNAISANTLLKTLEEPPGDARFVLASGAPDALLPTIRSRCQAVALALPDAQAASRWLREQGVAEPDVLLAAAGGQPQEALALQREGIAAAQWRELPAQVRRGSIAAVAGWGTARLIDALLKLCHDALCLAAGAAPRYFPAGAIELRNAPAALHALLAWQEALRRAARHAEHPWNAALLAESLIEQGRAALAAGAGRSLHSRA